MSIHTLHTIGSSEFKVQVDPQNTKLGLTAIIIFRNISRTDIKKIMIKRVCEKKNI